MQHSSKKTNQNGTSSKKDETTVPLLILEARCSKYVENDLCTKAWQFGKNDDCNDKDNLTLNVSKVVEAKRVNFVKQFKLLLERMVL